VIREEGEDWGRIAPPRKLRLKEETRDRPWAGHLPGLAAQCLIAWPAPVRCALDVPNAHSAALLSTWHPTPKKKIRGAKGLLVDSETCASGITRAGTFRGRSRVQARMETSSFSTATPRTNTPRKVKSHSKFSSFPSALTVLPNGRSPISCSIWCSLGQSTTFSHGSRSCRLSE
jgi:hypothetical protein